MGMFEVKVKLANIIDPEQTEQIPLVVDTRATLSWIPRTALKRLAVKPISRLSFLRAGGNGIERDVASVVTVIGWWVAMIWAVAERKSLHFHRIPVSSGRFCNRGGALEPSGAQVCPNCGRPV